MKKNFLFLCLLMLCTFSLEAKSRCEKKIVREVKKLKTDLLNYRFIPAYATEQDEYFYKLGQWSAYENAKKIVRKQHKRKKKFRW